MSDEARGVANTDTKIKEEQTQLSPNITRIQKLETTAPDRNKLIPTSTGKVVTTSRFDELAIVFS